MLSAVEKASYIRPMTQDPLLETERLLLRPAIRDDLEALVRLESDPDVRRFLGGPSDEATIAALRYSSFPVQWGSYVAVDRVHDSVLGVVLLERGRGELEVSYLFLPEHGGLGFAAEAVGALLDWAAANCAETEVIAVTQAANEPSLRLLARLGFQERERVQEFGAEQVISVRSLG